MNKNYGERQTSVKDAVIVTPSEDYRLAMQDEVQALQGDLDDPRGNGPNAWKVLESALYYKEENAKQLATSHKALLEMYMRGSGTGVYLKHMKDGATHLIPNPYKAEYEDYSREEERLARQRRNQRR